MFIQIVNEQMPLESEKLVQIHRAKDNVEGELVAGYLRNNGIEALVEPKSRAEVAVQAGYCDFDKSCHVSVMEHEADQARLLVAGFVTARADEPTLEELAAQKTHPTRERIHWLRQALREERRTFEFLGWLVVAFCVGGWFLLRAPIPPSPLTLLALLVVVGLLVGSWLRRRL